MGRNRYSRKTAAFLNDNDNSTSSRITGMLLEGGMKSPRSRTGGSELGDGLGTSCDDEGSVASKSSIATVLQQTEVQMLNVARVFVVSSMLTAAFITANVFFVVATIREENRFAEAYAIHSNNIFNTFHEDLARKSVTLQTLATELTILAQDTSASWPYVSFPGFHERCAGPLDLAKASSIAFSPLVTPSVHEAWEKYALKYQSVLQPTVNETFPVVGNDTDDDPTILFENFGRSIEDGIYYVFDGLAVSDYKIGDDKSSASFPIWQKMPYTTHLDGAMFNQRSNQVRDVAISKMITNQDIILSDVLFHYSNGTDYAYYSTPHSALYCPISHSSLKHSVAGALNLEFHWESTLQGALDNVDNPIVVILESSCSKSNFSFEVIGMDAYFLGPGDLHEDIEEMPDPLSSAYESLFQILYPNSLEQFNGTQSSHSNHCSFRLITYPTQEYKGYYYTHNPEIYRWLVLLLFFFTIGVIAMYDCLVERYQKKMVESATRTSEIVSALFPSQVRERLFQINQAKKRSKEDYWKIKSGVGANANENENSRFAPDQNITGAPVADLFPNATVLFADIAGFTAWSSEREPTQVFTLLESLYGAMDMAAKRFGVFKVETIGDCYVAATGLPRVREDHAEAMARFSRYCLIRNTELTMELEEFLGPGTASLAMRFGLHSGPVTAGILRGEKSRFQLFGDTMNVAARMESTSLHNKIHMSTETGQLLTKRGKGDWVTPRTDLVFVKNKGEVQTYWLHVKSNNSDSLRDAFLKKKEPVYQSLIANNEENKLVSVVEEDVVDTEIELDKSTQRLVDWNTQVFLNLLKTVVTSRRRGVVPEKETEYVKKDRKETFAEELEMVIKLKTLDEAIAASKAPNDEPLSPVVKSELRSYVESIAKGYKNNPFHNFEHASHVIMSATKLLKRIIRPASSRPGGREELTIEALHEYTYGISSDPLAQFAVVFSALVHDVGHTGVPNGQLGKENPALAAKYKNKSLAEQRSIAIAFDLLMRPDYENLRNCIHPTEVERTRFRQLIVNSIMATDIFDKELRTIRSHKWDLAFKNPECKDLNQKATVVIEYTIQASDVSHTMQHWRIYQKWNEQLFQEMCLAHHCGRLDKDPSVGWYEGELWFFDHYIIPLASNLKDCGVFGVSSDEYLNYAKQNREEWAERGKQISEEMLSRFEENFLKKKETTADEAGDESHH